MHAQSMLALRKVADWQKSYYMASLSFPVDARPGLGICSARYLDALCFTRAIRKQSTLVVGLPHT